MYVCMYRGLIVVLKSDVMMFSSVMEPLILLRPQTHTQINELCQSLLQWVSLYLEFYHICFYPRDFSWLCILM